MTKNESRPVVLTVTRGRCRVVGKNGHTCKMPAEPGNRRVCSAHIARMSPDVHRQVGV